MRRSHRKRHGSGNRSSASHRTRKRSRGTVKDKRHAALQARGSRLLSMLADVQQRMAAIQQSEGPTIDISTGSAVVPPSVVFRRRAVSVTNSSSRTSSWSWSSRAPSDIVAGHDPRPPQHIDMPSVSWDTPTLLASVGGMLFSSDVSSGAQCVRVVRPQSLVLPKPTALQATPRSATPPSYPATVSTPVRSLVDYMRLCSCV
mgnify:CR=1 FL=1